MKLTHDMLRTASGQGFIIYPGLLKALKEKLPPEFTAAEVVAALETCGEQWHEAAFVLAALESAETIPASGWIWDVAREAFRNLPEPLNAYADNLSADNWWQASVDAGPYFFYSIFAARFAGFYARPKDIDHSPLYARYLAASYAATTADYAAQAVGCSLGRDAAEEAKRRILDVICAAIDAAA